MNEEAIEKKEQPKEDDNKETNNRCRRTKERKIGFIIEFLIYIYIFYRLISMK